MSDNSTTKAAGLAGSLPEAFTAATVGGCCGGSTSVSASAIPAPTASTCCGTTEAASAAGACCDPAARVEAVSAGAGCCG